MGGVGAQDQGGKDSQPENLNKLNLIHRCHQEPQDPGLCTTSKGGSSIGSVSGVQSPSGTDQDTPKALSGPAVDTAVAWARKTHFIRQLVVDQFLSYKI